MSEVLTASVHLAGVDRDFSLTYVQEPGRAAGTRPGHVDEFGGEVALYVAHVGVVNQHDPSVAVSTHHGACRILFVCGHQRTRVACVDSHLLQHGRPTGSQLAQVRHA